MLGTNEVQGQFEIRRNGLAQMERQLKAVSAGHDDIDKDFAYRIVGAVEESVQFCLKRTKASKAAGLEKDELEWHARYREAMIVKSRIVAILRGNTATTRPRGGK